MSEYDELIADLSDAREALGRDELVDAAWLAELIAAVHEVAASLPSEQVRALRDELALLEAASRVLMGEIDQRLGELQRNQQSVHGYGSLRGHHKAQKLNRRA